VILYGDVLVWDISDLHPMTKALLGCIFFKSAKIPDSNWGRGFR